MSLAPIADLRAIRPALIKVGYEQLVKIENSNNWAAIGKPNPHTPILTYHRGTWITTEPSLIPILKPIVKSVTLQQEIEES